MANSAARMGRSFHHDDENAALERQARGLRRGRGGYGRCAWHREARCQSGKTKGRVVVQDRRAVVLWAGPESQCAVREASAPGAALGRIQRDIENFEFLSDDRGRGDLPQVQPAVVGHGVPAAPESWRCHVFFFFVHSFNIYTFSSLKLNANPVMETTIQYRFAVFYRVLLPNSDSNAIREYATPTGNKLPPTSRASVCVYKIFLGASSAKTAGNEVHSFWRVWRHLVVLDWRGKTCDLLSEGPAVSACHSSSEPGAAASHSAMQDVGSLRMPCSVSLATAACHRASNQEGGGTHT